MQNDEYQAIRKNEIYRLRRHYDFDTIDGVRSIPVPCKEVNGDSPTGRVEYYLRGLCFSEHWEAGRKELAIECLKKAQELMFVSDMIWKYDSFIPLVTHLHEMGLHDDARKEQEKIDLHFQRVGLFPKLNVFDFKNPLAYFRWRREIKKLIAEHERKKRLRSEYYFIQEYLPELLPKSLSGYSRMKNLKSKRYLEIAEKANALGEDFEI